MFVQIDPRVIGHSVHFVANVYIVTRPLVRSERVHTRSVMVEAVDERLAQASQFRGRALDCQARAEEPGY